MLSQIRKSQGEQEGLSERSVPADGRGAGAEPCQFMDGASRPWLQERITSLQDRVEEFTRVVAHDLREPMRAIDGFSHLLLEEYGQRLDAGGPTLPGPGPGQRSETGAGPWTGWAGSWPSSSAC